MLVLRIFALACVTIVPHVEAGGELVDPPGRNKVMGPNTYNPYMKPCPTRGEINLHGSSLFCGGSNAKHNDGGQCSACGDLLNATYPRDHDLGGRFASDITAVRAYKAGQVITARVLMNATDLGYSQFRLCPKRETNTSGDVLTECFNDTSQYTVLRVADTGATSYTGKLSRKDLSLSCHREHLSNAIDTCMVLHERFIVR